MAKRSTSVGTSGFIWLPRTDIATTDIKVNGESVYLNHLYASFTKEVCPEVGNFSVRLINADGSYTGRYANGQSVQLFVDYVDGTTERFEGIIDSVKDSYDQESGMVLNLSGGHLTVDYIQTRITASFDGNLSVSALLAVLKTDYGLNITFTNVATFSKNPIVIWNEKPFWDCVEDLCKILDADAYVDDDRDLHLFASGSNINLTEAIVWNDTLLNLGEFGRQVLTQKDNIRIYGDDGTGLPVIASSGTGNRESVVFDNAIHTVSEAQELADASYNDLINTDADGLVNEESEPIECRILPALNPGDKIWVLHPVFKITKQIPVYKFTHQFPEERTFVTLGRERKIKQIFKRRIQNELSSQVLVNPYRMTKSINFPFDSPTELASKDANVQLVSGKVNLSSGNQGTFTTISTQFEDDITEVHLRGVGSFLLGSVFRLSTDGGNNYENIALDGRTILTTPGKNIVLQVIIQSSSTEIDSIALLVK